MILKLKSIFKNPYLFSVVSKGFGVLIGFVFTIFQARYLGAEIKGQVTTVNSFVGILSIVSGFGIYLAYPYYKRNSKHDIIPIFLKTALLMLGIYSLISLCIILLFKPSPKFTTGLILNPLITYDGIISYITLIEVPNKRNATDMAVMFMELIVLILLWIFATPTFIVGILIITIKDIVKAVFFTFWWKNKIFQKTEPISRFLPKVVKFGFFPMLALLMNTLNYRVDVLMLNGKVSDAAIGVYSVGVLLAERVWIASDAMKGVMVSNISKGKDAEETAYVIRICNSLCILMMVAIVLFGKPFINIIFGSEFEGAYQITLIILAGVFPMNYYKMIDAYNVAMGKQKASFIMLTFGVLINIFANYILIPYMGIYGAGIASVVSYTLCSCAFIVYFCRNTKLAFSKMIVLNKSDYQKIQHWFNRKRI